MPLTWYSLSSPLIPAKPDVSTFSRRREPPLPCWVSPSAVVVVA